MHSNALPRSCYPVRKSEQPGGDVRVCVSRTSIDPRQPVGEEKHVVCENECCHDEQFVPGVPKMIQQYVQSIATNPVPHIWSRQPMCLTLEAIQPWSEGPEKENT